MGLKRSHEEAFKRKPLQIVKVGDFCVEHTVYKVTKQGFHKDFILKTSENSDFDYQENVIKKIASSATIFTTVKEATKTKLIELFGNLSMNNIWFATFLSF